MTQPKQEKDMRFTFTPDEREAVAALKEMCDTEDVSYRSIFELAKFYMVVRSQVKDNAKDAAMKRAKLALKRLKKRRKWEAKSGVDQIDCAQAVQEMHEGAPGHFVVRYTTDKDGRVVVAHHIAHAPYAFMSAKEENLAKYMAVEQWRMDIAAADLEEARRGVALVGVADGLWGMSAAYRYLRVLAKASDNAKDMHPNRLCGVYAEVPSLGQHLISGAKSLMPKKIADRVNVSSTTEDLEMKLCKAKEGRDPMTIVEWCEQRNAIYNETVEKLTL